MVVSHTFIHRRAAQADVRYANGSAHIRFHSRLFIRGILPVSGLGLDRRKMVRQKSGTSLSFLAHSVWNILVRPEVSFVELSA